MHFVSTAGMETKIIQFRLFRFFNHLIYAISPDHDLVNKYAVCIPTHAAIVLIPWRCRIICGTSLIDKNKR